VGYGLGVNGLKKSSDCGEDKKREKMTREGCPQKEKKGYEPFE
jgi:hypothetical protein